MTHSTTAIIALVLALATSANALPRSIEVQCVAPQIQFLGYSEPTTGAMGGYLGQTAICSASFPDSRMCTFDEIKGTTALPEGWIGVDAWMRSTVGDCSGWTRSFSSERGSALFSDGTGNSRHCDILNPIACCGLVP